MSGTKTVAQENPFLISDLQYQDDNPLLHNHHKSIFDTEKDLRPKMIFAMTYENIRTKSTPLNGILNDDRQTPTKKPSFSMPVPHK